MPATGALLSVRVAEATTATAVMERSCGKAVWSAGVVLPAVGSFSHRTGAVPMAEADGFVP